MNPHLTRAALISAAAAAILYLAISLIAGWRGVVAAFGEVGWPALVAALALSLANYGLRIVRWRLYLGALGARLDWETAEAIYFAGFAFTATPGKAGELLRGVFLANEGVSFLVATAAFLSERLSDLVGVILIALPGAATAPNGGAIVGLGAAIVATLSLALGSRRALEGAAAAIERLRLPLVGKARALVDLMREARRCHDPARLVVATALSLAAWSCEAFAFYLVLVRMGIAVGLGSAMSVYALSMLAGAISFLPGGLGGAEAVMMGLLMIAGAPQSKAVAATLIIRLATLWFAVAIGVAAMAIERRRLWPRAAEAAA